MKPLSILFFLLISSCSNNSSDSIVGNRYKDDLVRTINQSNKIIVTEHSFPYDFEIDPSTNKFIQHPELTYHEIEVRNADKEKFISLIQKLPGKTQDAFTACTFEPHHTVKFYKNDKLQSTMNVCFACNQVDWDGTKNTPPWSIYGGLSDFITSIGLKPKQDWYALATKTLKK